MMFYRRAIFALAFSFVLSFALVWLLWTYPAPKKRAPKVYLVQKTMTPDGWRFKKSKGFLLATAETRDEFFYFYIECLADSPPVIRLESRDGDVPVRDRRTLAPYRQLIPMLKDPDHSNIYRSARPILFVNKILEEDEPLEPVTRNDVYLHYCKAFDGKVSYVVVPPEKLLSPENEVAPRPPAKPQESQTVRNYAKQKINLSDRAEDQPLHAWQKGDWWIVKAYSKCLNFEPEARLHRDIECNSSAFFRVMDIVKIADVECYKIHAFLNDNTEPLYEIIYRCDNMKIVRFGDDSEVGSTFDVFSMNNIFMAVPPVNLTADELVTKISEKTRFVPMEFFKHPSLANRIIIKATEGAGFVYFYEYQAGGLWFDKAIMAGSDSRDSVDRLNVTVLTSRDSAMKADEAKQYWEKQKDSYRPDACYAEDAIKKYALEGMLKVAKIPTAPENTKAGSWKPLHDSTSNQSSPYDNLAGLSPEKALEKIQRRVDNLQREYYINFETLELSSKEEMFDYNIEIMIKHTKYNNSKIIELLIAQLDNETVVLPVEINEKIIPTYGSKKWKLDKITVGLKAEWCLDHLLAADIRRALTNNFSSRYKKSECEKWYQNNSKKLVWNDKDKSFALENAQTK